MKPVRNGDAGPLRGAVVAGLVLALVPASGCTSDIWLGSEETPLAGERIAVSERNDVLEAAGGGPIAIPEPEVNPSWSQPGGNAANAPQHLAAGASLSRGWSASAGQGSSGYGRLTAPPIVVASTVYTLDAAATVTATSGRSGQRLWRASLAPANEEAEEGFGGGITADFGRIVVATGFGDVFGLDPASGQRLWHRDFGLPIRAAPTASNGRVYVITINNEVHCLDIETGEVIWDFRRYSESAGLLASTSPAVADGIVVVPYRSGELLAFDAETGQPAWGDTLTRTGAQSSLSTINDIAGRPAIAGGVVFAISHSGRIAAIDLKEGTRLWERNIASTQTPWVAGGTLFVAATDGRVTALDAGDGSVKWVTSLPQYEDPADRSGRILYSGPILAGGRLLIVSSNGALIEIAPETGAIIGQTSIGKRFYIPPVVASGSVYLLADDATVVAMR